VPRALAWEVLVAGGLPLVVAGVAGWVCCPHQP
jgi:hypothetical protein